MPRAARRNREARESRTRCQSSLAGKAPHTAPRASSRADRIPHAPRHHHRRSRAPSPRVVAWIDRPDPWTDRPTRTPRGALQLKSPPCAGRTPVSLKRATAVTPRGGLTRRRDQHRATRMPHLLAGSPAPSRERGARDASERAPFASESTSGKRRTRFVAGVDDPRAGPARIERDVARRFASEPARILARRRIGTRRVLSPRGSRKEWS
jgi:hypothetical protein